MPTWLKELFRKHMTELAGVLLTLLSGTIFWKIIPLLLSPLWTRLSTPTLQRMLGLSFLSAVALLTYVVLLRRKLKRKLRIRFGLYWDKEANPFCPACQSLLTGYSIALGGEGYFACVKCNRTILLSDRTGKPISFSAAQEKALESFR